MIGRSQKECSSRSGITTGSTKVTYAIFDGTAIEGADYASVSAKVKFTAGQTSKTVTVNTLQDVLTRGNETV